MVPGRTADRGGCCSAFYRQAGTSRKEFDEDVEMQLLEW